MSIAEFFEVEYRLDQVDDDHPWTRLPRVPIDNEGFAVKDLEIGKKYNVRWRHVDEAGAFSPWTVAPPQLVRSRLPPPPDVIDVRLTDDDCLKWRLEADSPFVAGFEIRTAPGDHRHWGSAEPAHEGLWPGPPFPLCGVPRGERTIQIVAVDIDGQRSATPAVVVATRSELPAVIEHDVYVVDLAALNFPGILIGGAPGGGAITALPAPGNLLWPRGINSFVLLWDPTPKAPLWRDGPLWPQRAGGVPRLWDPAPGAALWGTLYSGVSYRFLVNVPLSVPGVDAVLRIQLEAAPSGWRLEFRRQSDLLWGDPGVPKALLWDPDPAALLWARNDSPWLPWIGEDQRVGAGLYEFNLLMPPGLQPSTLTKCKVTIATMERTERFTAVAIEPTGTRLPIASPYRAITRVRDLAVRAGTTAVGVLLEEIDPFKGPKLRCIDQSGAFVAGVVDATVEGY